MKRTTRKKQPRQSHRSGTATIELAICLPVLLAVTFSIIDTCNYLHLQQKLTTVAFETTRLASESKGNFNPARALGMAIAESRGLSNVELLIDSDLFSVSRVEQRLGWTVAAQASVPVRGNMPGPFVLYQNATATSEPVRIHVR